MVYSEFQQASIDAICKHYEKKSRVLCADEAGMGKTFIARGVIEKLADAHLKNELEKLVKIHPENVGNILRLFTDSTIDSGGNSTNPRKEKLVQFIRNVTGEEYTWGNQINQIKDVKTLVLNKYAGCKSDTEKVEFLKNIIKNLPELYVIYNNTKNGEERKPGWDFTPPTDLGLKPFRVLYICSNLAIAEQNTRKLALVPQRSNRGSSEKADRLSTLWHFLDEYPTPYLEMYSITSTVSKIDTPGTKYEENILKEKSLKEWAKQESIIIDKLKVELQDLRPIGERKSLKKFQPDLIIFDEFQNFGDIINLFTLSNCKFNELIGDMRKSDKVDSDKVNSLERIRRITDAFANQKKLFLSATPFHQLGDDEKITRIGVNSIIRLLGEEEKVKEYDKAKNIDEKADFFYKLGIFRNERRRLFAGMVCEANHQMVSCESNGLLKLACSFKSTGQGDKTLPLIKTTPSLGDKSGYSITRRNESKKMLSDNHPRYKEIEKIVCSNKVEVQENKVEIPETKNLNTLLWIPPTRPSKELKGVFAQYNEFSKSIAFSSLEATPKSICELLNRKIKFEYQKIDNTSGELSKYINDILREVFSYDEKTENEIVNSLIGLLQYSGCTTEEGVIQYCEDGCLKDVLKEFKYVYPDDTLRQLKRVLEYGKDKNEVVKKWKFAEELNAVKLAAGDNSPTLRRTFNSPFPPFVVMTTSIGSEGLDFHLYCNRLIHYTKPNNVIKLEQKNGRIDRRDSLAVRRYWQSQENCWNCFNQNEYSIQTGGLSPHWYSGEKALNYYYFYTEDTNEKNQLDELMQLQENYRNSIGAGNYIVEDKLNLSPFCRTKK